MKGVYSGGSRGGSVSRYKPSYSGGSASRYTPSYSRGYTRTTTTYRRSYNTRAQYSSAYIYIAP